MKKMQKFFGVLMLIALAAVLTVMATAAPIEIATEEDLLCLMNQKTNSKGVSFADWTKEYKLTANITLSAAGKPVGGTALKPKPIGLSGNSFQGTFDGDGHTVTFADRCYSGQFSGLFGLIEYATVKNVTVVPKANKGNEFSTLQYISGVVAVARDDCLIENCKYTGYIANTNSGCKGVGGIVGRIECRAGKTVTVRGCVNEAEVAGYIYAGGIVGLASGYNASSAGKIIIENCMNKGFVRITNAGTQNVGGIVGYWRTYGAQGSVIRDCLNAGTIKSMNTCAGGIIGKGNENSANAVLERCVNVGKIFSEKGGNYVHGIVGAKVASYKITNCFDASAGSVYSSETDGAAGYNGERITAATDLTGLGENWVIPTVGTPELALFHSKDSHGAGVSYLANFEYNEVAQAVEYICPACGEVFYTDTDLYTDIYTDAANGDLVTDTATSAVGSASAPFRFFSDAMRYAATVAMAKNTDVTVHIVGTATVGSGYTTPECEKNITVTGGTLHFAGEGKKNIYLGGPLTFRDISFTAEMPNPGLYVYAQNHKLVMDTGITMANGKTVGETAGYPMGDGVKMYLHGGFDGIGSTEQFTMDTDITIRSGDYWLVAGWNEDGYAEGTGRVTVGKKDADDELFIHYLATYSRGINAVTGESKMTVIFDGEVNLHIFYPTTMNEPHAGYEGALYETDLLLLGDLNTTPRTAYGASAKVDVDADPSCTNTVLNVYTDMRLAKAIKDTACFDKDETDSSVQYDGSLTTVGTVVSLYPYYRYCLQYLDGHVGTDTCTTCGAPLTCAHANKFVLSEANCTEGGEEYCLDCGESFPTEAVPDAHDYRWVPTAEGYAYVCAHNDAHVLETVAGKQTEFFVSDNGTTVGGFTASAPSNDFDAIMHLAASVEEDVTVYILGKVTMPDNASTAYEIYQEPAHENTITIRGYKDGIGTLSFGRANVRMGYILAGDTTFENIEFSTGASKNILYITAEHHHLTMGENISADIHRNNSSGEAGGKVVLVGGCYQNYHEPTCAGTETHMTVYSGNYFSIIGGSANKTCGLPNGTIHLELLGDITVGNTATEKQGHTDRMLILGTQGRHCGDIVCTVDGVITSRNAICIGAYGKDNAGVYKAKNVTVTLLGGALLDYAFPNSAVGAVPFDENYDPATASYENGTQVLFPFGNDMAHATNGGILASLDSLLVSYDPTYGPSVSMANRFLWEFGGDAKFTMVEIEGEPCTSADGRHTPLTGSETVVVEVTCYNAGSTTYTCATCGATYAVTVEMLPHDFGAASLFTEATCVAPAIYAAACENDGCSHTQYTTVGDKSEEHTYVDGICKYCNNDRTANCDHIYGEEETVSTGCGTGTRKICTLCGKVELDVVSTNHSFGKYVVTVEPMDIAPGIKTRTCKKCGKTESAILYYGSSALSDEVLAVDASGALADFSVDILKLTKNEKAALNALLQKTEYGSEVKISYTTDGNAVTGITYSIPIPAEYKDMENIRIYVRDGDAFTAVNFELERGYIVFTY